jgi:sugar phosphate permease
MTTNLVRKVLVYRWFIFWIMALAYVVVYFHRLSPAVVALDLQKAFETTGGFMGLLASAYFYPYALMQFPAGLLSDSLGPRKTVTIFLLLAAIGSFAFGMSGSVEGAVLARILVGLGVSMVFIPTMKLLSQWFRVSEFAYMAAIVNTMGGVGALTAAAPLAYMTSEVGWRMSFELIGLVTLVMALLVWLTVRNRPSDLGWPSIAEIDHRGSGVVTPPQTIGLLQGAKRVLTEKYFWPIALWFFLVCGIFFGFGGLWAGPYLMHTYGMNRAEAGSILNMIAVGLIVGSPFHSFVSSRILCSRKKTLTLSTACLAMLLAFLSAYPSGLPVACLYIFMFLLSVTASAIVVIAFTTTKELFPVEIAGTSVGAVNLFPFLGGAIFQPVMGSILDSFTKTNTGAYSIEAYSSMILFMLAASIVAFLATFFMKDTL